MSLGYTKAEAGLRDMWDKRTGGAPPPPGVSTVPRFTPADVLQAQAEAQAQSQGQAEGQSQGSQSQSQAPPEQSPRPSPSPPSESSQSPDPPQPSDSSAEGEKSPSPTPAPSQEQPSEQPQEQPSEQKSEQPAESTSQSRQQGGAPPPVSAGFDWSSSRPHTQPRPVDITPTAKVPTYAPTVQASAAPDAEGIANGLTQVERGLAKRDIAYEAVDGALLLKNGTELSYKVPEGTTLIRVYGPVGRNYTAYGSQCYADLDPPPAWWVNGSYPLSASEKAMKEENRTLFLLPVDPDVRTTVKVGTLGLDATCYVSGFSSYPFH